jgi:hypothetical protein
VVGVESVIKSMKMQAVPIASKPRVSIWLIIKDMYHVQFARVQGESVKMVEKANLDAPT